jgi:uncharacterized protein (TIGR02145 family)
VFEGLMKKKLFFVAAALTFFACSSEGDKDLVNYKTVKIGSQIWMAENMNRDISGSKCYNDSEANCDIYGRLYDWNAARLVCPSGWHLPSDEEWTQLTDYVGGSATAGIKLKAKNGWNSLKGESGNGTDDFGFSALPGGYGPSNDNFYSLGYYGNWWSTTESDSTTAYYRNMSFNDVDVSRFATYKIWFHSVRCLKD